MKKVVEVTGAVIVGNRLKAVLDQRELTQKEFARRVGISFRQANRIILGDSEPSLLTAERMAAVVGVPIDKLFTIRVEKKKSSAAA